MRPSKSNHETAACLAAIDIIRQRSGKIYKITARPENQNRNSQDIDFIISADRGSPRLAVEHTTLDSFDDQRGLGQMAVQFIGRVEIELRPYLKNNTYYTLTIPTDFIPQTTKGEQRQAISELKQWIANIITPLQPFCKPISRNIVGGKFKVWFGRGGTHPTLNGKLLPGQNAPPDLDQQRIDRIERALNDKLPKLLPYSKQGYETLLILDDTDYALSNSRLVEEKVLQLRSKHSSHLPDHIYQLASIGDDVGEGWILKEHDLWAEQIPNRGPFYDFPAP